MKGITLKNTGKRIQVRFDRKMLLIDSNLYQAKQYIKAHYFETLGARAINNGYSFPATDNISLNDWLDEFKSVIGTKDLSKRILF